MTIDPVAAVVDRLPVSDEQKTTLWIAGWYVVGAWCTGVYFARLYAGVKASELVGALSVIFWPVFWFIETIRYFGGII